MNVSCVRLLQNSTQPEAPAMANLPMVFIDTSRHIQDLQVGTRALLQRSSCASSQTHNENDSEEDNDDEPNMYMDSYSDCIKRFTLNCLIGLIYGSCKYTIIRSSP